VIARLRQTKRYRLRQQMSRRVGEKVEEGAGRRVKKNSGQTGACLFIRQWRGLGSRCEGKRQGRWWSSRKVKRTATNRLILLPKIHCCPKKQQQQAAQIRERTKHFTVSISGSTMSSFANFSTWVECSWKAATNTTKYIHKPSRLLLGGGARSVSASPTSTSLRQPSENTTV
jgi:hypothetical protein